MAIDSNFFMVHLTLRHSEVTENIQILSERSAGGEVKANLNKRGFKSLSTFLTLLIWILMERLQNRDRLQHWH